MEYKTLRDYWKSIYTRINWTKYVYTCCLWYTNFAAGLVDEQLGSALPDIQQRTHVPFAEASLYISVFCAGSIVGSLMVGLMYGRIPPTFYLCFASVVLAALEAALPWCKTAAEVYTVTFAMGVNCMGMICYVFAELCALWGSNVAIPMLINFLFFSFGGVISSAITAPFLPSNLEARNSTTADIEKRSPLAGKLYIPYTLSALLTIIAVVSNLVLLWHSSRKNISIRYLDIDTRFAGKKLPSLQRIPVILIIGTSMILLGTINSMSYFLPYFLHKQAHRSMPSAAYTLSLYTTFQGIGRFTGFVLVKEIGNYRLLVGHCIICLSSLIGLWNCVTYNVPDTAVYMAGAGAGFGISVLLPSFSSLVEETVMPVTGSVSGFLFACFIIGEIIMSASIGYLSETFTPLVFIYATISESLLFLLSILMTQCLLHYLFSLKV